MMLNNKHLLVSVQKNLLHNAYFNAYLMFFWATSPLPVILIIIILLVSIN